MRGKRIDHNWELTKGGRYRVVLKAPVVGGTLYDHCVHEYSKQKYSELKNAAAVRSTVPIGQDGIMFTLRLKFAGDDHHYDVSDFEAVYELEGGCHE